MWYFTSKLYSICECDEQHRLFGLSGWWVQYHFYFPVQIQARHLCACVFVVGGRRRQPPTSRGLGHRPPAASEQKIECATTRTHARSPHGRTYEWQWFDFGLDIRGFWILRVRVRVWFLNHGFWVRAPKYQVRFRVWFFTRDYPRDNRLE